MPALRIAFSLSINRSDDTPGITTTMDTTNMYTIGGVKVQFPVKPYPSQMAMMAQVSISSTGLSPRYTLRAFGKVPEG